MRHAPRAPIQTPRGNHRATLVRLEQRVESELQLATPSPQRVVLLVHRQPTEREPAQRASRDNDPMRRTPLASRALQVATQTLKQARSASRALQEDLQRHLELPHARSAQRELSQK